MPAVLKIDRQRRIVSSTFYGPIRGEDLLAHRATIKADPDFDPSFAEIVDFSGVNILSVADSALSALAGTQSLFNRDVPHIVVTPAGLPRDLALKYQEVVRETRPQFYVVESIDDAHTILRGLGYDL